MEVLTTKDFRCCFTVVLFLSRVKSNHNQGKLIIFLCSLGLLAIFFRPLPRLETRYVEESAANWTYQTTKFRPTLSKVTRNPIVTFSPKPPLLLKYLTWVVVSVGGCWLALSHPDVHLAFVTDPVDIGDSGERPRYVGH